MAAAGNGLAADLYAIEEELASGDGDVYDRHLAADALVVVPGAVLDREGTVAAMDASPGWDEFSLDERGVSELADDAALLTYRFHGRRGEDIYEAILASAYRRDPDGGWKLAHHQQTPIESGEDR